MKWHQSLIIHAATILSFSNQAWSAETVLLDEKFNSLSNWIDLSTLISWGSHSAGTSAFQVGKKDGTGIQCVTVNNDAIANSGYSAQNSLKTFTALDFKFAKPIDHRNVTLTIQFDLCWQESGPGEAGRFMVVLMDTYPTEGVKGENYNNFSHEAPYGTPGLHVRFRPSTSMSTLLQYGGGYGGEYEKYGENGVLKWWLPGFIQNSLPDCCKSSCAGQDQCFGSPGVPPSKPWPDGSWTPTSQPVYGTSWATFIYKIEPRKQQLIRNGQTIAEMNLPDQQASAPHYKYYEQFDAMRLYWRSAKRAYLANLKVTQTGDYVRALNDAGIFRRSSVTRQYRNGALELVARDGSVVNRLGQIVRKERRHP